MAIRVGLTHRTTYRFDRPVHLSPHEIRLRPAPHCRTPVLGYSLDVKPAEHFLNWQQDPYGNWVARLVFPKEARELDITVDLTADMAIVNPFDFFVEPYADFFPFAYADNLARELKPFLEISPDTPRLAAWVERFRGSIRAGETTVDLLVRLNHELQQAIRYLVRMEAGVQTPETTLENGSGSCRDSGWLLVQILRRLGIAARFASGYLIQLVADQKPLDGPAGTERDFTDLHAWAEAFVPGAGWVGLDPTSGLLAGEGHLPLACTADPGNAAPVIGFTDPCEVSFAVEMKIARVHEDPRVTRPYTEAQWKAIDALGEAVDRELVANDVRLTQGGEPTFVSIDDMDGAEWNYTASSPAKRTLADALARKLKARLAPGGLLHDAQGKWYPGEPLPRWAVGIYWRADGTPLWRDPALLADPSSPGTATFDDAQRFATVVAKGLGVPASSAIVAFEDVPKFLAAEAALPVNIDPLKADLSKPDERARLAQLLQAGIDKPAGLVLPLRASADGSWETSPWPLRRERLYLLPGDSPMGLRLPLNSLPWVQPEEDDAEPPVDPFAPRGELPDGAVRVATKAPPAKTKVAPKEVIKTALCVQVRAGHLYVFMPPLAKAESYVVLLAVVEATASEIQVPVAIEGYTPPRDARIRV
ncbi:MAG: transglutaminase family protein, partial [Vicinamibacteria bacterium]